MALARIAWARTRIERGSRVRELVFGLQDALMATVGLVAGAVSMGAGEYLSSAAQQRVTAAAARECVAIGVEEPCVAQEGLMTALEEEGLDRAAA